jgi:hypothetical protein
MAPGIGREPQGPGGAPGGSPAREEPMHVIVDLTASDGTRTSYRTNSRHTWRQRCCKLTGVQPPRAQVRRHGHDRRLQREARGHRVRRHAQRQRVRGGQVLHGVVVGARRAAVLNDHAVAAIEGEAVRRGLRRVRHGPRGRRGARRASRDPGPVSGGRGRGRPALQLALRGRRRCCRRCWVCFLARWWSCCGRRSRRWRRRGRAGVPSLGQASPGSGAERWRRGMLLWGRRRLAPGRLPRGGSSPRRRAVAACRRRLGGRSLRRRLRLWRVGHHLCRLYGCCRRWSRARVDRRRGGGQWAPQKRCPGLWWGGRRRRCRDCWRARSVRLRVLLSSLTLLLLHAAQRLQHVLSPRRARFLVAACAAWLRPRHPRGRRPAARLRSVPAAPPSAPHAL